MTYHYTESGLDTVYLLDGYRIETHPAYGELITIDNVRGLHDAIGMALVELPRPLNGAEFRFLRREMDLTQKALGALLGVQEQTVALWEKTALSKVSNEAAERLTRLLYAEHLSQLPAIGRLIRRIVDIDPDGSRLTVRLQKSGTGWQSAA